MFRLSSSKPPAAALALALAATPLGLGGCTDPVDTQPELGASAFAAGQADISGTWNLNIAESGLLRNTDERRDGHLAKGPQGTLEIEQDAMTVAITYGDDRMLRYHTDGRVTEVELPGREVVAFRAAWVDGALVIERELAQGGSMTTTYRPLEEMNQLRVTVEIVNDHFPDSTAFVKTYDPAGDSE